MSKLLSTLLLAAVVWVAQAQTSHSNWCGTHGEEVEQHLIRRLQANKAAVEANGGSVARNTQYVPIKFHLVAQTNGAGRISEATVLGQLCELNEDFAPLGIQFFLKDGTFNYVPAQCAGVERMDRR
jgi:hypothetical protein